MLQTYTLWGLNSYPERKGRVCHIRGNWQEAWDTSKEGAMGDGMACPPASSPLPPGQSHGFVQCFKSVLDRSRNNRRVLLISVLCSLSTSPYYVALPQHTLQVREISSSPYTWLYSRPAWIQIGPCGALIHTAQKYSSAKEHHQSCKIKHLKVTSKHCWTVLTQPAVHVPPSTIPNDRGSTSYWAIPSCVLPSRVNMFYWSHSALKTELLIPLTVFSLLLITTISGGFTD